LGSRTQARAWAEARRRRLRRSCAPHPSTSSPRPWRPPGRGPIRALGPHVQGRSDREAALCARSCSFWAARRSMRFEPAYAQRAHRPEGLQRRFPECAAGGRLGVRQLPLTSARPRRSCACSGPAAEPVLRSRYGPGPACRTHDSPGSSRAHFWSSRPRSCRRHGRRAHRQRGQSPPLPGRPARWSGTTTMCWRRRAARWTSRWPEYIRLALKHRGNGRSRGVVPRAQTYFEEDAGAAQRARHVAAARHHAGASACAGGAPGRAVAAVSFALQGQARRGWRTRTTSPCST